MRIKQQPTEAIFRDAYLIADAIIYQQDQQKRMEQAMKREGIMSNKVTRLSNDILRLEILIQERIKAWESNYGSATVYTWKQHLADHPRQARIAA